MRLEYFLYCMKGEIPVKDLTVPKKDTALLDFEYLHIKDWMEMVEVLKGL